MSTTNQELRRAAIRRTLAHHAGAAPDASAVAEAILYTWHQIAARIEPVIGPGGVGALLDRSLHLTGKVFPWLAISGDHANSIASLAILRASFETREATVAAEASHALLVTFSELLANLIGESLTERLLAPIWVSAVTFDVENKP